ncbi:Sugar transport protein 4 [Sesamum alatum]|uniref:Sugar transport protein 4 n=1 Tax=Sesamum alatum TaxID=300844 RepID=A0AAE1Y4Q2_9LAMI|nr:Sugar transport protein 4 [Sesamum alatum]
MAGEGTPNVHDEFSDLVDASAVSQQVRHPWRTILEPKYRPQLVITCLIPLFQQLTGINVIMFYAPVLFKTLGFADDASLMSAVVTGLVNVFATAVSIVVVDRFGRRVLFLEGGIQMLTCQIGVGVLIASVFGVSGNGAFSKELGNLALALICIYVAAFCMVLGTIGVVVRAFLFFFGGWVLLMTVFVYFFVPETKNMPIEEMNRVWKAHWFWGKYIPDDAVGLSHKSSDHDA